MHREENWNAFGRLLYSLHDHVDFFHPSVCHTCKEAKSLKTCANCKSVSYCSKEHQVADWSNHKALCKVISSTDKKINVINQNFWEHVFKQLGAKERDDYFLCLEEIWEEELKRELFEYEWQIMMYRKYCLVCNSRNAPIECKACLSVFYCSIEHQKKDSKSHAEFCPSIKLNFDVLRFNYHTTFKCCPSFCKKPLDLKILPKTLEDLVNYLIEKSFIHIYKDMILPQRLKVTDGFAPMANILFGLEKTKLLKNNFLAKSSLVVHVVGADFEESSWDWNPLMEFAFHFIKNLCKLTLIFVGAEAGTWNTALMEMSPTCGGCKMTTSNTKCYASPHYYHAIVNKLDKPDIVVVFNCGFFAFNSWIPSLPSFFKYPGVPLFLTDYRLEYLEKDLKLIYHHVQKDIQEICKPQKNPFACLTPQRHDFKIYPVHYKNAYFAIFNSK